MPDKKIRKLVLAALFAALTAVMTMVIRVPSPIGGYLNLGDCAVLLAGWALGPLYGALAAGLGSMLADLLGYPLYAPGTLVIKGLMAVSAALVFRALRNRRASLPVSVALSGALAESVMVAGYFLYEALPFPVGLGMGALANIPFNVVQGVFGLAAAAGIYLLLSHSRGLVQT